METPQLEDGYTKIANKILDSLCKINLSSYQIRVIIYILRKTYGFHKKEDWISVSQMVKATGIKKSHISRTKKELLERKIVTSLGNKISFQKDSRLWCNLPEKKKVTSSGNKSYLSRPGVTNSGQELPVQGNTKDTIQKIIYKRYIEETPEINEFINFFKDVNPSYKRLFGNKTEREVSARLINQYGIDKLKNLMLQLPEIIKLPYAPTITTPYELEMKMGKLLAFLTQEKNKKNKGGVLIL